MAFVDDNTALLGIDTHASRGERASIIYRTTDRGTSWSAVPDSALASIDAMAAIRQSVWVIATRWENQKRRGTFLRSANGGVTWERPPLPTDMNDVTVLYRASFDTGYAATAGYNKGPVFWRTTNAGTTWSPVLTPHDQGVHKVPSSGVRVNEIATVGQWIVVREYGTVFVTRVDTIQWRKLNGIEHVAVDRERDQLFVLTDSLQAAMLDRDLNVSWTTSERIPSSRPSNVEKVLARDGVGFVSMTHGQIYEARAGVLRLIRPRG